MEDRQPQRQPQQPPASPTPTPLPTILAAKKHLRASLTLPTETDYLRHRAYKAGVSIPEIATTENTTEEEIEESILLVRIDNAKFSPDEAGLAVRKLLFQKFPKVSAAMDEALSATTQVGKKIQLVDKETGETETIEDFQTIPDHTSRMRAVDAMTKILSVVQPKDPQIQITDNRQVNSQTNILNAGVGATGTAGSLGPGMNSPEEVIRSIVSQRRQALGDGSGVLADSKVVLAEPDESGDEDEDTDADEDSEEEEEIENEDEDEVS